MLLDFLFIYMIFSDEKVIKKKEEIVNPKIKIKIKLLEFQI